MQLLLDLLVKAPHSAPLTGVAIHILIIANFSCSVNSVRGLIGVELACLCFLML